MGKTTIEWTSTILSDGTVIPGYSFNPWWGCTKISAGCTHCYADTLATRYGHSVWGPKAPRRFFGDNHWAAPLTWNTQAQRAGERRRVFCASMADVFERHTDNVMNDRMDHARQRLFDLIERTPNLDWLLLTKRPSNIGAMMPVPWHDIMPSNVWLGTSVENQEQAEQRIPELTRYPASVLFLSCEPLLAPLRLKDLAYEATGPAWAGYNKLVDWIIVGGESGNGARAMDLAWARDLRDQCRRADRT